MSLQEVQRGLALLLTDEALRERFAADPQGVGRALNLDAGDAGQLAMLAGAEVERFARSLRAKRWNEIQKLLPVCTRVAQNIGFPLPRAFLQFAQTYVPQGRMRHAQDALAFAEWAARQPQETFQNNGDAYNVVHFAYMPDLLRYEAGWLEMQIAPSRRWMLRRFAYPVPKLAHNLSQSSNTGMTIGGSASPRPTFVCWLRRSPAGRLHHYGLSLPGLLFPAHPASSAALKREE